MTGARFRSACERFDEAAPTRLRWYHRNPSQITDLSEIRCGWCGWRAGRSLKATEVPKYLPQLPPCRFVCYRQCYYGCYLFPFGTRTHALYNLPFGHLSQSIQRTFRLNEYSRHHNCRGKQLVLCCIHGRLLKANISLVSLT